MKQTGKIPIRLLPLEEKRAYFRAAEERSRSNPSRHRCGCGRTATDYSAGWRCERCKAIEARLSNDYHDKACK
jgi:hypothetical protein